jgi:hypothetical protein
MRAPYSQAMIPKQIIEFADKSNVVRARQNYRSSRPLNGNASRTYLRGWCTCAELLGTHTSRDAFSRMS